MLDRIVCIPSNVVVTSFVVSCHWPGCRSSVTFLTGVVITSCTTSLKIVFIFFVPPHIYVTLKKALYSVRWLFLRRFRVIFAITLREILTFRDLILAFICIFFFHLFCSSHSGVLILFFLISFSRLMVSETFWFFLLTNGVLVLNLLFSPDLTIIIFFIQACQPRVLWRNFKFFNIQISPRLDFVILIYFHLTMLQFACSYAVRKSVLHKTTSNH